MSSRVVRVRRGFTLIELLVVIAIIAILAAILFPVLTRAREASKKSKCLHNMREIGLAIHNYINDYGDRFPWAIEDYRCDRPQYYWVVNGQIVYRLGYTLSPYVKNEGIYHCPSDVGELHENSGHLRAVRVPMWRDHWSSYGYPDIFWAPDSRLAGRPIGSVIRPTKATMGWEHESWHYLITTKSFYEERYTINVLFVDGHAAPMGHGYFNSIIGLPR